MLEAGASRDHSVPYFFDAISHYVYAGGTPSGAKIRTRQTVEESGSSRRWKKGFTNEIWGRTRRSVGREKATGVGTLPLPFQFLAAWVVVWVARHQTDQVEYLRTVNRALMERVGKKRPRFTDAERRKLAMLGKKLGRKALAEVATIATPDTILRWYGELVAKKYDGSARRGPGRPETAAEIVRLLVAMATRNTSWGYTRLRGHPRTWATRSVGTRSKGS